MRRIVTIVVLTVLLGSCSGVRDGADNSATPGPATTHAAATGELNRSFDVGGFKLHLRCEGKSAPGSPTVVYLHGLAATARMSSQSAPRWPARSGSAPTTA